MKKTLIGVAVLIAALAFAGCGNGNQKKDNTQAGKAEKKSVANRMLIIVDPQVDFTTGSLATAKGPEAMDRLAQAVDAGVLGKYSWVVITQDSHPASHCSFIEQGGDFPTHCVQGTKGEKVYPKLQKALDKANHNHILYLQKATQPDSEEFSIFKNPESSAKLHKLIADHAFEGIDICGIATDYCVYETAKDLMTFYSPKKIRIVTNCIAAVDDNDTKLADLMSKNGIQGIGF